MAGEVTFAGVNAAVVVGGTLSSGLTFAASTSTFQRVYIGNAGKVEVNLTSANFSATATHKIQLWGVLPPHRMDGNEGTRTSAPIASATIVSTITTISAVTYPYQMVDIELAPGASSTVVIAGRVILGSGGPST